ncbi:D-alanyl-D-alanine carboxypeptidase family protein [Micromonospora sp. KC721]|uniref:D-alanyl-D-alanine carboxypeptidase family protein n=1 Tax=Micromonospora sp. KC721 TaxID=2530380 RepID=UPI00104A6E13|nr:serine hydrolase [Micromonospora sp. KC721]TDB79958.1 D-alanyl-D-alanine carboxypeptidase [Micromonospora sp. KC721]
MRTSVRAVAVTVAVLASSVGVPVVGTTPSTTGLCPPVPSVSRPPRPVPPRPEPAYPAVAGAALATPGLVSPAGAPAPPPVAATSWLVADLDSGTVLGGCGPHEYATPASVQKLLLAATVLPKLDPHQVVTVTAADLDIEPGSSIAGLAEGGRYPVETLWLGLLLKSGNEAANALARLGGGPDGLPGGLRAMNAHARHLGALRTHAANPSGLDAPGQFTTAYDLALIARACFADPTFRRYDATLRAVVPAQPALGKQAFEIQNDNQLLYGYPGAFGGKTGFTDLARHTYVGAAERGGRRLVATVLGAEVTGQRAWQQGAALLDWGFALPRDASVGRLVRPGELTGPALSGAPGPQPALSPSVTPPALAAAGGPVDRAGHRWARPGPLLGVALVVALAAAGVVLLAWRRRHAAGRRR